VEFGSSSPTSCAPSLQAFWPGALVFHDIDSPILWPSSLATRARDAKSLGASGWRPSWPAPLQRWRRPGALVERMRADRGGRRPRSSVRLGGVVVLGLIAALKPIVAEIGELTGRSARRLAAIPNGHLRAVVSRRRPTICPAPDTPSWATARRYRRGRLAADAGMIRSLWSRQAAVATSGAPATSACGSQVATLADSTRHWHPWAEESIAEPRQGAGPSHAIRTLGRA